MKHELQKAGIWKRIAAWLFDFILWSILAVALGTVLSWMLGYDGRSADLDQIYARYEQEYGVVFDITQSEYLAMSEEARQNYDGAYEALAADPEAGYAYTMLLNLTLVITTGGIFFATLIWDFVIPLCFGNGQTLGKKIFGLCLVRNDGVKMNTLQLFTRTVLGKFAVETMIPVYVILMLFWGTVGLNGTLLLLALLAGQTCCVCFTRTRGAIHDLLAGTAVVDMSSQTIFSSTEELIEYQKRIAAERAARAVY